MKKTSASLDNDRVRKDARNSRDRQKTRDKLAARKDLTPEQKAKMAANMRAVMLDPKKEARYRQAVAEGRVGPKPAPPIDFDDFEKLCRLQCTQIEIASFFKRSEDTIKKQVEEHYNSLDEEGLRLVDKEVPLFDKDGEQTQLGYKEIAKKMYAPGRISLRRAQFKSAVEGESAIMQIWLGKQYLGQADIAIPTEETDKEQVEYDVREKFYNEETPLQTIT